MRVLIVNPDGLLAAMPTIEEYNAYSFDVGSVKVLGRVDCDREHVARIFQERARVRLVAEGFPTPGQMPGDWLWISVVQGKLVLL